MLEEMVYCNNCQYWCHYDTMWGFLGDGTGVCKGCHDKEEKEGGFGFPLRSHL